MPIYEYQCICGRSFEVMHSMGEECETCQDADIECTETGSVKRDYDGSSFKSDYEFAHDEERERETGELTKEFIEEEKRELKERKKELENREFDPDESDVT